MRRRYLIQGSKNNNIVYYTTTDNNIINVHMGAFNVIVLSNIYNEMGIITCKGNIKVINDNAFYDCRSLTSIEIPNSVTIIGDSAFVYCSNLTSIEIPNSVTSIGERVFIYCSSLTSIVVDSGNTKYDSRNGCNAIIETASNTLITGCKNTIIPNSVTTIGLGAFSECSSLTSIEIPNSVTSIGEVAFYDCSRLSSVYVKATTPPTLGNSAFYRNASNRKIYVPRASLDAYKTASGWKNYASAIEPYDY